MAIAIGKYNGDFKAFVDFASAAKKGSAIAQLARAHKVSCFK